MNLRGERLIPTTAEAAWTALNDPATLQACIIGCEALERVAEHEFLATIRMRVGPVSARFQGRLEVCNIVPATSYTLAFHGQGGLAGAGDGLADIVLRPYGENTVLEYTVRAQVGGKLARLGSRLIDAAGRRIVDNFFSTLAARLQAGPGSAAGAPAASGG